MPFPGAPTLDPRALIVAAAERECALWNGRGPADAECHELLESYWRVAYGSWEADFDHEAWCGIFALWCVKQGIDCPAVKWQPGYGFVARRLTQTSAPAPGDVAYLAAPFQHHAIVTAVNGDQITTVNGNQPGIREATGPRYRWTCFYSIEPLLDAAA